MAAPEFNQIDLLARDVAKSIAFYRALGLKIPKSAVWHGKTAPHHVRLPMPNGMELSISSPLIARGYNKSYRDGGAKGSTPIIGFGVASRRAVDAVYRKLTKLGHAGKQPPWDAFWGSRYAIVADPDGHLVGLMSPVDPKRRYPGPDA